MVRVLIADAHPIVRRGVRVIIETQPGWSVCGETADGRAALELALQDRPDVVVAAIELPLLDGVVLAKRLKTSLSGAEVLIFTLHDDEPAISAALAAGVRGYLLKSETADYLIPAIAALGAHRSFFSPTVSDMLLDAAMARKGKSVSKSFTVRELEVLQWVCEGASNAQIARRLAVSVKTVETHRGATFRKAGVHSAAELVRFAMKNHLIAAA
jgi:DNA-binding NarL/FixJ family response regulator